MALAGIEFGQSVDMDNGISVTTWNDDAPVIGFQVDAFNWRLRRAREAKGWTRAELARQCGIFPGVVGDAEKLRRVSDNAREKMALALGVPEDVLFPGEIDALPKNGPPQIELSMTREDIRSVESVDAHMDMIEGAERSALRDQLIDSIRALPPRQAEVIADRFGFTDGVPKIYEEVGAKMGVSRERVRQIEADALRKLRRSGRSGGLYPFVDERSYVRETPSHSGFRAWFDLQVHRKDLVGAFARELQKYKCCLGHTIGELRRHIEAVHDPTDDLWPVIDEAAHEYKVWLQRRPVVISSDT